MTEHGTAPDPIGAFIARWDGTEQAERANYQRFLNELCDLLGLPQPELATGSAGDYRYERGVMRQESDGTTSHRRLDLYKRGCFVLEAKQGSNPKQESLFGLDTEGERRAAVRRSKSWAASMVKAKGQAEHYARDLPAAEGWPPFIIVCDVGFCFDVYADFTGTGKHYAQFPDREGFRLYLPDLHKPEVRDRLRAVWTDPHALDPSRKRVQVTREIAQLLAKLASALEGPKEKRRHAPQTVATFLMRCIFTMFAQSVDLLPKGSFTKLLEDCRNDPPSFLWIVGDLWRDMNAGGFSGLLRAKVPRFNGGLFAPGPHGAAEPLPVDADMLDLLVLAAKRDWAEVEPAIFGTLLENALDTRERGQLGAHFTPRAFVERLVLPTVMEPLREEWDVGVKAAAVTLAENGDRSGAAKLVRDFHARLCTVRVLDPACGTGNFLYVTLELMKRLEGEVLDLLADLMPNEAGRLDLAGATVDPHQFLGLEKNPRAVPVAELVLWIGYLQWHVRTRGDAPPAEPILRDFKNIREADALLSYEREELERDAKGVPVTRWGGRMKQHPITGEDVPDETDRKAVSRFVGAKPAAWPEAEFIVGNPPFIAGKDLRAELGDGYVEALWKAYPKVPESADIALHFWWRAAQYLHIGPFRAGMAAGSTPPGTARRFGFITSNSLRQVFCRRVVAEALDGKPPLHLAFAVPDHPWADGHGAAAVRIAMTVAAPGTGEGVLQQVLQETRGADGVPTVELVATTGRINANLTVGTDVKAAKPLRANEQLASPGVKLHGAGFIVSPITARSLGLGKLPGLDQHIRPYLNGNDLTKRSRQAMVIDLFGLSEAEVRQQFPDVYQHVLLRVKPARDQNPRPVYRRNWWIFGEPRRELRPALRGLSRYIATVETAKHRIFAFVPAEVLPDNKLIVIGSDSALILGVLQSRSHVVWMLAQEAQLEDRPVYAKGECFDPFPFPAATPDQRAEIAAVAEELDAHRKARLAAHPHLTLTALYNTLALLRAGTPLAPAERDTHDAGQVSLLRALHDRLDAAVAAAYGWPADLPDAEIVSRVVALNAERVAEEAAGTVRWLRPEFQAPEETRRRAAAVQTELAVADAASAAAADAWPKEAPAQFVALRAALARGPGSPAEIARRFKNAPRGPKLPGMLETLAALGQARLLEGGRYTA